MLSHFHPQVQMDTQMGWLRLRRMPASLEMTGTRPTPTSRTPPLHRCACEGTFTEDWNTAAQKGAAWRGCCHSDTRFVLWALGPLHLFLCCSAFSSENLVTPLLGPPAKERGGRSTGMSGCGTGEGGGAEVGTGEGGEAAGER